MFNNQFYKNIDGMAMESQLILNQLSKTHNDVTIRRYKVTVKFF